MKELIEVDPSFNEGMFITKVNNIFVMLHSSVMTKNLDRVRHFLSADLEHTYENVINELNSKGVIQMYDELNVQTTEITNIEISDIELKIYVDLKSRYMDYYIDEKTKEFVDGINNYRVTKLNHLVFTKKRGASYNTIDQKCPSCGANIDVNSSGQCPYCGTIFDAEDYDWILTSIETVDV